MKNHFNSLTPIQIQEKLQNSKGQLFYGMHFCPGVAEYAEPGKEPFRVFLNEETIRKMNPSFTGRPVYVEHVDNVDSNIDEVRKEADGWVVESFYNAADGKTWAKFLVVSEKGFRAVREGKRLSNSYFPQLDQRAGVWNGVSYISSVVDGEHEHLGLVSNPRYDESVVMSPDEFKAYNEKLTLELKRLSNSKSKENTNMSWKVFKRTKVENSIDPTDEIELPLSKKVLPIATIVNGYDKLMNLNGYADPNHMVKCGNDEMSVGDLVKKHMGMQNEMDEMKKKNAVTEEGGEPGKGADDDDPSIDNGEMDTSILPDSSIVGDRGGDCSLDNEDDEPSDDEKKKKDEKKSNSVKAKEDIKAKASKLKNANTKIENEQPVVVNLPSDKIARGKSLYGSN